MEMRPRTWLSRLFVTCLSTVVTVLLFELVLRLSNYMPEYWLKLKTLDSENGSLHVVLDTERLYRVKPKSKVEINDYGFRDYDFTPVSRKPTRVLVLGDSFVMANNVPVPNTIPKQLEKLMGADVEVFNMGVSGYGPDQELQVLLNEGLEFAPQQVVLVLYAGNDFRDLALNRLYTLSAHGFERSNSNLVTENLPILRLELLLRLVFTKRFLPEATEDLISKSFVQDHTELLNALTPAERSLRERLMAGVLGQFLQVLGRQRLLLAIIPTYEEVLRSREAPGAEDLFENERTLARLAKDLQIECIDLSVPLSSASTLMYDQVYQHLNADGYKLVALELFKVFKGIATAKE